jgi:hypothetical protein
MFKLLVSNTLSNSFIVFLLCGPGIAVLTTGPDGSSGKNGCWPEDAEALTAAAATHRSCGRREDVGVRREAIGRKRVAARREAMMNDGVYRATENRQEE